MKLYKNLYKYRFSRSYRVYNLTKEQIVKNVMQISPNASYRGQKIQITHCGKIIIDSEEGNYIGRVFIRMLGQYFDFLHALTCRDAQCGLIFLFITVILPFARSLSTGNWTSFLYHLFVFFGIPFYIIFIGSLADGIFVGLARLVNRSLYGVSGDQAELTVDYPDPEFLGKFALSVILENGILDYELEDPTYAAWHKKVKMNYRLKTVAEWAGRISLAWVLVWTAFSFITGFIFGALLGYIGFFILNDVNFVVTMFNLFLSFLVWVILTFPIVLVTLIFSFSLNVLSARNRNKLLYAGKLLVPRIAVATPILDPQTPIQNVKFLSLTPRNLKR